MSKKILIINTGGTLSSVKGTNGLIPGMSSNDMLEELRMVSKNLELETEDFCSLDSANIGPTDWAGLAKLISQKSYDYHGIVVIHGTDTMAYTSSMLSFMLQNISIPVVITGSQLSIANVWIVDTFKSIKTHSPDLGGPAAQHYFAVKSDKNTRITACGHMNSTATVFQCISNRIGDRKLTAGDNHRYGNVLKHK